MRKPELGRPADSRLTAEAIAADPRLTGVEPFDAGQDVDVVDEINAALGDFDARVDAVENSSGGTRQHAGLARLNDDGVIQQVWLSAETLQSTTAGDFNFTFAGPITLQPNTRYVLGLDAAGNQNTARETQMEVVGRYYTAGGIELLGWARTDTSAPGGTVGRVGSDWKHRIVLALSDASAVKNVTGPLDPLDTAVITNLAALPNSAAAIWDPGTSAPRLVRRRADGSVWYGPVFSDTP
ncbi:hypothetical protein [Deinococcus arenicola]|uniref:Uncharacterized protein n=1 Tax=Deinococcus arenicola TaxID=2994950 RepID=A0ABU4DV85_9DEIO|nr:hypothetical protein [Deinococcus sp. ZS9-10]MDV6376358.1 hypothetical protein [Deinococcus sp. ZS9-10]